MRIPPTSTTPVQLWRSRTAPILLPCWSFNKQRGISSLHAVFVRLHVIRRKYLFTLDCAQSSSKWWSLIKDKIGIPGCSNYKVGFIDINSWVLQQNNLWQIIIRWRTYNSIGTGQGNSVSSAFTATFAIQKLSFSILRIILEYFLGLERIKYV